MFCAHWWRAAIYVRGASPTRSPEALRRRPPTRSTDLEVIGGQELALPPASVNEMLAAAWFGWDGQGSVRAAHVERTSPDAYL